LRAGKVLVHTLFPCAGIIQQVQTVNGGLAVLSAWFHKLP